MGKRSKAASLAGACAFIFGGAEAQSVAVDAAASAPVAARQASTSASSTRLEEYFLLALSPSEGIAVLRSPDRRLVTLRVGSALTPARARLVQVMGDRLRFDTADEKGARQTAWMIRSANPEQPPEVQRVSWTPPPAPSVSARSVPTVLPLSSSPSTNK